MKVLDVPYFFLFFILPISKRKIQIWKKYRFAHTLGKHSFLIFSKVVFLRFKKKNRLFLRKVLLIKPRWVYWLVAEQYFEIAYPPQFWECNFWLLLVSNVYYWTSVTTMRYNILLQIYFLLLRLLLRIMTKTYTFSA